VQILLQLTQTKKVMSGLEKFALMKPNKRLSFTKKLTESGIKAQNG
jgi:hypothetical protein